MHSDVFQRRLFLRLLLGAPALFAAPALLTTAGCDEDRAKVGRLLGVWGRKGISPGRLQKPRAMTIDREDQIYIVDITARIQVFTTQGQFVRGWQTPIHEAGRPTGMSIDNQGNLRVADTHYFRVLTYSPSGELLDTLGGTLGHGHGEFGFVTDVAEDAEGNLYVAEYGEYDRIQKFSPGGDFILEWGGHGSEPAQFARPQSMVIDPQSRVWIADACNHRIQVFDTQGRLMAVWGTHGSGTGQLAYPYGLVLDREGHVYVSEFGNHRVQKFTSDGQSLGCWGTNGRAPGELLNPWALVRDSRGILYVLDTGNNRVQCVEM